MLKFTLGAFMALVAFGLIVKEPQPDYQSMMEQVVRISVDDPSTPEPQDSKGTGFVSDSGYIVSAAHVVGKKDNIITGKTKDGKVFNLEIVKIIPEKDLVFLKTDEKFVKKAKLACQPLKIGQKIIAMGGPTFLDWITTVGTVAGERRTGLAEMKSADVYITDISLGPGMSGGPVFDVYGNVVGINDAIIMAQGTGITEKEDKVVVGNFLGISVIVAGEAVCEELNKLSKH